MRTGLAGWLAAAALVLAGSASAHHSFAMFDQSKQVPLNGTVREFQWTNPHAFIHIDVANNSGGSESTSPLLSKP